MFATENVEKTVIIKFALGKFLSTTTLAPSVSETAAGKFATENVEKTVVAKFAV